MICAFISRSQVLVRLFVSLDFFVDFPSFRMKSLIIYIYIYKIVMIGGFRLVVHMNLSREWTAS